MEIATDNKPNGFGVGRFSGLQIGSNMRISTVGYEKSENIFTRTNVEFDISQFEKDDLSTIDFYVDHEKLSSPATCGYEVEYLICFQIEKSVLQETNWELIFYLKILVLSCFNIIHCISLREKYNLW